MEDAPANAVPAVAGSDTEKTEDVQHGITCAGTTFVQSLLLGSLQPDQDLAVRVDTVGIGSYPRIENSAPETLARLAHGRRRHRLQLRSSDGLVGHDSPFEECLDW